MPLELPDAIPRLRALAEAWRTSSSSERASFQPWLIQFCEALGVPAPVPPAEHYTFELPVKVIDREGRESTNFIDCWKAGHFALEAKATDVAEGNDQPLRKAFGQVRNYVAHTKGVAPPFLMVVDVPRTLIVWDRWSGEYGGFPAGRRINLATLHERPDDIRLLQDIFTDPAARDPRGRAQAVTKDIAGKLAELSAAFEGRGHEPERVARFLMRCVFCFFAEDVELLPRGLFKRTLETARTAGGPERVAEVLSSLWKTMDEGGSFGADLVRRFNGHFFRTVDALPLEVGDVSLLIEAAEFDWSRVEPSIFGTLLVRALDPTERHRLGAEYTPREYIERLVEPTVVEPIRDRWTAVQAAVLQLTDETDKKPARIKKDRAAAVSELLDFHKWMRGLRFLDPACGSGNFLYVTMAAVKRVELEVIREIERVRGREQMEAVLDEVHPRQFYGIEVKPWAREIAELTLWIGYHQFWRETHGGRTPPDPVLEDTGTIECRDAVLAWDEIVHRPEKDRPDPTPRIVHPVTGELVPDPEAKLPYYEYVGARKAEWPEADFIVGNPPYIGKSRKRVALGDGYINALQVAYPELAKAADFVMCWWHRGAEEVVHGRTLRVGMITTNSIVQTQNQRSVKFALARGATIPWIARDHPWVDSSDGAQVRVAMTVISAPPTDGTRMVTVDARGAVTSVRVVRRINADLSAGVDVNAASQQPLAAQAGLCTVGFKLYGEGFVLDSAEASRVLAADSKNAEVVRAFRTASDLTRRARDLHVVDFAARSEADSREYAVPYDIVRTRVKPHRDANANRDIAARWWQLGHLRPQLRDASAALSRIIVTPETSRQRFFEFLDARIAAEGSIVCIAVDDPALLGILSSTFHLSWFQAVAGKLGVGNDFRYNKRCFDSFPFVTSESKPLSPIGDAAELLDAHRKRIIGTDATVTMTGMYNVVEKLRAGTTLTAKEREIYERAACGVLKDMHDELDSRVAEAYGWSWPMEREEILERLVALHDERVAEENAGRVRWLRPEYQIPRFAAGGAEDAPEMELDETAPSITSTVPEARSAWPGSAVEQLAAVKGAATRRGASAGEVANAFEDADLALVRRHLDTLVMMGEV